MTTINNNESHLNLNGVKFITYRGKRRPVLIVGSTDRVVVPFGKDEEVPCTDPIFPGSMRGYDKIVSVSARGCLLHRQ